MKTEIDITIDNLAFEIVQGLTRAVGKLDEGLLDGAAMLDICLCHRRLAIAHLLASLDVHAYSQNLQQSASAYAFMLRKARLGAKVDPYYLCRSRAEPFWDALAAGAVQMATEIATLAPREPRKDMEDSALFKYFDIIMAMAQGQDASRLQEKLRAFEAEKDESLSFRYDASAALLHKDEKAFLLALQGMSEQHAGWYSELKKLDSIAPEDAQTQVFVFIEGIALARLASTRGLGSVAPQRFIPDVALSAPLVSFSDPWSMLEA